MHGSPRKGWWRLFVPGAGMPTALDARVAPRRAATVADPQSANVDAILAVDPALWTDEDRAMVRAAQARAATAARADLYADVLAPDRLHRAFRQTLRWLLLPVAVFVALHVWGDDLPSWVVTVLRIVDELVLAGLAIALLGMSRRFRYHELTAAAAVATASGTLADTDSEAPGPRRLLDTSIGTSSGTRSTARMRVRAIVEPE